LKNLGFQEKFSGILDFFKPNPNAILFYKDLTVENTKLFTDSEINTPTSFVQAFETSNKYFLEKEYAIAEAYIDLAIEFEPNNPQIYLLKAKNEMATKGNVAAINQFFKAIELDGNLAEAFRRLGICYYNHRRTLDAHEHWDKAVQLGDLKSRDLIEKYP